MVNDLRFCLLEMQEYYNIYIYIVCDFDTDSDIVTHDRKEGLGKFGSTCG